MFGAAARGAGWGRVLGRFDLGVVEGLAEDAFPGEDKAFVLVDMVVGSCRPALEAAGGPSCRSAAHLIAMIGEIVHRDLEAAASLAAASEAG